MIVLRCSRSNLLSFIWMTLWFKWNVCLDYESPPKNLCYLWNLIKNISFFFVEKSSQPQRVFLSKRKNPCKSVESVENKIKSVGTKA